MTDGLSGAGLTSKERNALFVELAAKEGGATAQVVYEAALARGDTATPEAFHNLGRRLAHRGVVTAEKTGRQTTYRVLGDIDAQWLDTEEIASIIDPEYPLIALTAVRESFRQLREVDEQVWVEARERLLTQDARSLFKQAVMAYADYLKDMLQAYDEHVVKSGPAAERARLRKQVEESIGLLRGVAQFGLGLSRQALLVPVNVEHGLRLVRENPNAPLYNTNELETEILARVEDGPFLRSVDPPPPDAGLLIAAVDGSSRGGLLAVEGAMGDFAFGHSPQISINTAAGLVNREVRTGSSGSPAFMRLPEKPEDMQQRDNKYTIMAKVFYPDLSESEYMHSTWNAMDLLESKATLAVMSRWYTPKTNVEVRPADVILRDGTIVPHDRDSNHYGTPGSYGQIVRDLLETSWRIAQKCRDDEQTVAGVVKNAQMAVFSPVLNHFLCQVAANRPDSQIRAWPLQSMNALPDQAILSRVLTAGRKRGDAWLRTAVILRPFHATSDFAIRYSKAPGETPVETLIKRMEEAKAKPEQELRDTDWIWRDIRGMSDPYIRMMNGVWYAGFYMACLPRLDRGESLPRFEALIVNPTQEAGGYPAHIVSQHVNRIVAAVATDGFDVAAEHSFFDKSDAIDVLPRILIRAHETVKVWATELLSRVQEYMDYHLARYLRPGVPMTAVRVRKWRRDELVAWVRQMQDERERQAGAQAGGPPRSLR